MSSDSSPHVAIVVLAWNHREDTEACLASLALLDYPALSLILVDNGSTDDTIGVVRARFPSVRVIENGANLGFAEGNNVGIRSAMEAGADFVLLLNNDTLVDPGLVGELVAAWKTRPDIGFLGARIFYADDPARLWMGAAIWDPAVCQFSYLGANAIGSELSKEMIETSYACGCALFFDRQLVERIGLMDPRFFCYFEEADWCWRAAKAGLRNYYVPAARLWHKVSAASGGSESPMRHYYRTRNLLLWAKRNLTWKQRCKVTGRVIWSGLSSVSWRERGLYWTLRRWGWSWRQLRSDPLMRAWRYGLRDYFLGRLGPAPQSVVAMCCHGGTGAGQPKPKK